MGKGRGSQWDSGGTRRDGEAGRGNRRIQEASLALQHHEVGSCRRSTHFFPLVRLHRFPGDTPRTFVRVYQHHSLVCTRCPTRLFLPKIFRTGDWVTTSPTRRGASCRSARDQPLHLGTLSWDPYRRRLGANSESMAQTPFF